MFFGAFDGAQIHGSGRTINQLDSRKMFFKQDFQVKIDMIELDTKAFYPFKQVFEGGEIAVTPPIGVCHVITS